MVSLLFHLHLIQYRFILPFTPLLLVTLLVIMAAVSEEKAGNEADVTGPARIFVGRAAVQVANPGRGLGRLDADIMADANDEPSEGPIAAFAEDDDGDEFEDTYDEFDQAPIPTRTRTPPNAPGMRVMTPENDESQRTDRAWPGLGPPAEDLPEVSRNETGPSWLGTMPPVHSRADGASDEAASGRARRARAWKSPLLDFSDQRESRPPWSLETEEDEGIELGEEEGGELPVHEPMSYGEDGYFADEPLEAAGADDAEAEAVTGNWNRLTVLASGDGDASEQETTRFGTAPAPVWQAQDPGAEDAPSELEDAFPWSDSPAWAVEDEQTADMDAPGESGSALPPIRAMGSVLQQELNARKPVQPKAVVLKTLDGVSAPPSDLGEEAGDFRSRVPSPERGVGLWDGADGAVSVHSDAGSGRLLLVVAATLLICVGAVWRWQDFAAGPEAVHLENTGGPSPVAEVDAPASIEVLPETTAPSPAVDGAPSRRPSSSAPVDTRPAQPPEPAPTRKPAPRPSPAPVVPAVAEGPSEEERVEEQRRASRADRMRALQAGVLFVTTDSAAYVYVDGTRVAKAPMERPGLKLQPGHYDVRVVPRGRGRAYVTNTRVDAGRVRNIRVDFLAKK